MQHTKPVSIPNQCSRLSLPPLSLQNPRKQKSNPCRGESDPMASSSSSATVPNLGNRLSNLRLLGLVNDTEMNLLADEHVSNTLRNCIRTLRQLIAEEIETLLDHVEEAEIDRSADEDLSEVEGSIIHAVHQIIAKGIEKIEKRILQTEIDRSWNEAFAEAARSFTDALHQFIVKVIKNVGEIGINRSGNEVLTETERSLIWAFEIFIAIETRKFLGLVEVTEMNGLDDEGFTNEERDFLHTLGQLTVNEWIRKFKDA